VLQVTDAIHGYVHVRALVSAADAPTLWDLRCLVRERLVGWLRERHPEALPRTRAEVGGELKPQGDGRFTAVGTGVDARVFGGDAQGRRRARDFTGPTPEDARTTYPATAPTQRPAPQAEPTKE